MTCNPEAPRATWDEPHPTGTDGGPAGRLVALDRVRSTRSHERVAASTAVRVLIADGHALVRAGFRALLEGGSSMNVVAEAATGEEALDLARRRRPEVVLMDANLPGLDGVEATRRIVAELGIAVMMLTADSESDERIFAALRAGATGLLVKDTDPADLVWAVQALARNQVSLSPALARRLIVELVSRPEPGRPKDELLDELTAREREVTVLVALGLSNDEIAQRLVVSPATAKTHVSRAMVKVGAHDRAQLVVLAYQTGLVLPRTDGAASAGRRLAAA
jgi:DNA-binding NarL/FixJ family response regulator